MDRREFFRGIARFVTLGGIGMGAGIQARRSLKSNRDANRCTNDWICRGCNRVNTCILPQAQSMRLAAKVESQSAGEDGR